MQMQKTLYSSVERPPDLLLRGQPISTWPESIQKQYLIFVKGYDWQDARGEWQRSEVFHDLLFEVYYMVRNEIVYGLTQNREIALEWLLGH